MPADAVDVALARIGLPAASVVLGYIAADASWPGIALPRSTDDDEINDAPARLFARALRAQSGGLDADGLGILLANNLLELKVPSSSVGVSHAPAVSCGADASSLRVSARSHRTLGGLSPSTATRSDFPIEPTSYSNDPSGVVRHLTRPVPTPLLLSLCSVRSFTGAAGWFRRALLFHSIGRPLV
jgi:hypothetical protein